MSLVALNGTRRCQAVNTPPWLWHLVEQHWGSELHDPCPATPTVDGLDRSIPWQPLNFVNPPYNALPAWIERAVWEWRMHGHRSLLLVPARTNSTWFLCAIWGQPHCEIIPIHGQVRFAGRRSHLPGALCLLVVGFAPPPRARLILRPLDVARRAGHMHATRDWAEKHYSGALVEDIVPCLPSPQQ